MRYHRRMTQYERQQRERCWQLLPQVRPSQRIFGIMGLGVLGEDAGHKLVALDFAVAGWSRSRKTIAGIESFHGHTPIHPSPVADTGEPWMECF
ncbi:MAG: NAD(P)-dependent oxidoreductase [Acidiferrobacterales bacterium]